MSGNQIIRLMFHFWSSRGVGTMILSNLDVSRDSMVVEVGPDHGQNL